MICRNSLMSPSLSLVAFARDSIWECPSYLRSILRRQKRLGPLSGGNVRERLSISGLSGFGVVRDVSMVEASKVAQLSRSVAV